MANASACVPRDHPAGFFADVGLARELWQGAERGRRRQRAWLARVLARGRSPPPHLQSQCKHKRGPRPLSWLFADVGLARELWQGAERGRRRQGAWLACVSAREQLFLVIMLNPMQAQARPETTRLGPLLTSISLAICGRGRARSAEARGLVDACFGARAALAPSSSSSSYSMQAHALSD